MAVRVFNYFKIFFNIPGFKEAPYFDTHNLEALREFRTDDGEMLKRACSSAVDKTVETVKKGAEDLNQVIHKKSDGAQRGDEK